VNNAQVGPGGGERELHLDMGIYGLNPQMLPSEPQYLALGHVHKPQEVRKSPSACYSGSLLQLDFGERQQEKSVTLVEVHPRRPAEVTRLAVTAGRSLVDVGGPTQGVQLNDLAPYAEKYPPKDAWLRVFVDVDIPVANLPALVRETLPNAVHIERVNAAAAAGEAKPLTAGLSPIDLFGAFYRSDLGRGRDPSEATVDLFRRLLDEETRETAEA
jgi:exonuclease SbcD